MTESVFVVHYTHKHGDEISAYSTRRKAEAAADNLMSLRLNDWDEANRDAFDKLRKFDQRLKLFHQIEKEVSYGERISIFETDLL